MWLLNQGDTEWVREGLPPPERGSQGLGTKIDIGPSVLGVMGGAAETYLALGECENAVICATADIDSKEHRLFGELRTMAFISLGRAKARLGRAEEAASAFQRAIEHAQLCHLRYFELIAHRYERHSIAITANQQFSAWDNVFPDPAMTVAAIDRLVHHSTIIEMNGESYRKRSAVARINAGDNDPPNGAPDRPS